MTEKELNIQEESFEQVYLTIRDFCIKYPTWTESTIRAFIYSNTANFNKIVVFRVLKNKILLSVPQFWKWIEMQNCNEKAIDEKKTQIIKKEKQNLNLKFEFPPTLTHPQLCQVLEKTFLFFCEQLQEIEKK